jgi:hypothetical protein
MATAELNSSCDTVSAAIEVSSLHWHAFDTEQRTYLPAID